MAQDVTVPPVVQELFPDLDLGDVRRNRRFQTVIGDILDRPGQSLPQIFPDPTQYRAIRTSSTRPRLPTNASSLPIAIPS